MVVFLQNVVASGLLQRYAKDYTRMYTLIAKVQAIFLTNALSYLAHRLTISTSFQIADSFLELVTLDIESIVVVLFYTIHVWYILYAYGMIFCTIHI